MVRSIVGRQVGLVDLFVFPWTAPLTAAVL